MITTEQFEHKLIEYLAGELSDAERREVEEYLQTHPEASELKGDFSLLCAAGKSIRESNFPADLLLAANRQLAARLADSRRKDVASTPSASSNGSPAIAPHRTLLANWRRRLRPPVLAAVLAALAILLVGAVTQRAALADMASSLLQRVVTFNDEPLSDSQQQVFDEFVEITETTTTIKTTPDELLQKLGDRDGVLTIASSGDGSISSFISERAALDMMSVVKKLRSDSQRQTFDEFVEASETADEKGDSGANVVVVVDATPDQIFQYLGAGDMVLTVDGGVMVVRGFEGLLPAAKIGSQSPGVAEDQSWGDIKKAVGSTADDSP